MYFIQAIIKSASYSNSQAGSNTQQKTQEISSKPQRLQYVQQKEPSSNHYTQQKPMNVYDREHSGDQININDRYNYHAKPLKASISTVTSPLNTNHVENDSESNFDDVSSCASDSAIGENNYGNIFNFIMNNAP